MVYALNVQSDKISARENLTVDVQLLVLLGYFNKLKATVEVRITGVIALL